MQKAGTKMTVKKPTLPSIDNSIAQSVIATIPMTSSERLIFLKRRLARYEDKNVYCGAFGKDVTIIDRSIGETCKWACKSRTSTIMALNILHVIRNAEILVKDQDPKEGNQIKYFHFVKMHILWVKIRYYGVAKLTVGEWRNGNIGEYCITDFSIKKLACKKKKPESGSTRPMSSGSKPRGEDVCCKVIKRKGSNKKSTSKKNNKK